MSRYASHKLDLEWIERWARRTATTASLPVIGPSCRRFVLGVDETEF